MTEHHPVDYTSEVILSGHKQAEGLKTPFEGAPMYDHLAKECLARAVLNAALRQDGMTGLLNKEGFGEKLQESIDAASADGATESQQGFAVVFFDLNKFKSVNDTLGHEAGDDAIKAFGKTVTGDTQDEGGSSFLRRGEYAARLGGDEFVLLLRTGEDSETGGEERVQYPRKTITRHNEGVMIAGIVSRIKRETKELGIQGLDDIEGFGASAGVAFYQPHDTRKTILDRADKAMTRDKGEDAR